MVDVADRLKMHSASQPLTNREHFRSWLAISHGRQSLHSCMTRVILIRHGQALSNLDGGQVWIPDAALTDRGKQQCQSLQQKLADIKPDHILVSPLLRTLQTCKLALAGHLDVRKALIYPMLQETSHFPSDTPVPYPRNQSMLEDALPGSIDAFDWSLLSSSDDWYSNDGIYLSSVSTLVERARLVLEHISTLSGIVVVVSHGAFIRYLLGLLPDLTNARKPGYYYNNCEARSYELIDKKLVAEEILWNAIEFP